MYLYHHNMLAGTPTCRHVGVPKKIIGVIFHFLLEIQGNMRLIGPLAEAKIHLNHGFWPLLIFY